MERKSVLCISLDLLMSILDPEMKEFFVLALAVYSLNTIGQTLISYKI